MAEQLNSCSCGYPGSIVQYPKGVVVCGLCHKERKKEMNIYIVTREGAYRHEILGVFNDFSDAAGLAAKCCDEEPDDYHQFYILFLRLNDPSIKERVVGKVYRVNHERVVELVY